MDKEPRPIRYIIDNFDSDFSPKKHGSYDDVFRAVLENGRFSTFEMTQTLMNTLKYLVAEGKIKELPSPYPYHMYEAVAADPTPTGEER